jgi:hypothetical protein
MAQRNQNQSREAHPGEIRLDPRLKRGSGGRGRPGVLPPELKAIYERWILEHAALRYTDKDIGLAAGKAKDTIKKQRQAAEDRIGVPKDDVERAAIARRDRRAELSALQRQNTIAYVTVPVESDDEHHERLTREQERDMPVAEKVAAINAEYGKECQSLIDRGLLRDWPESWTDEQRTQSAFFHCCEVYLDPSEWELDSTGELIQRPKKLAPALPAFYQQGEIDDGSDDLTNVSKAVTWEQILAESTRPVTDTARRR